MTFYHFTAIEHWPSIDRQGKIATTESNVGSPVPFWPPYGDHYAPDVVWLLDLATIEPERDGFGHGLVTSAGKLDKTAVRIEVAVPAIRWLDWPPATQTHPEWRKILIDAGGGPGVAEHWYLWPAPITRRRWRSIEIKGE